MYRYAVQGHYGGEWANYSRERTIGEALLIGGCLAERWERVRVIRLVTGVIEREWKCGEIVLH